MLENAAVIRHFQTPHPESLKTDQRQQTQPNIQRQSVHFSRSFSKSSCSTLFFLPHSPSHTHRFESSVLVFSFFDILDWSESPEPPAPSLAAESDTRSPVLDPGRQTNEWPSDIGANTAAAESKNLVQKKHP